MNNHLKNQIIKTLSGHIQTLENGLSSLGHDKTHVIQIVKKCEEFMELIGNDQTIKPGVLNKHLSELSWEIGQTLVIFEDRKNTIENRIRSVSNRKKLENAYYYSKMR